MIIVPNREIIRPKISELCYRLTARTHDGVQLWEEWFDTRLELEDFARELTEPLIYECAAVTFTQYTATGNTNITVPERAISAILKVWGAGGSGGGSDTPIVTYGGNGGGAGYASATIDVTPGNTLVARVGAGGAYGPDTSGGGDAGSGGGYSGIFITSVAYANRIVIAGGGGGGGGTGSSSGNYGGRGGAGGGNIGEAGVDGYTDQGEGGGGGTQSAGGIAYGNSSYNGTDGSQLNGGDGGSSASTTANDTTAGMGGGATSACGGGGGGGGGLYGGGGGARGGGNDGGGGGGGGSNYVNTGTNLVSTQGSGQVPPNQSDSYYISGKGVGGNGRTASVTATAGGNGLVVVGFAIPVALPFVPIFGVL